jgi:hypothetical protein
VVVVVSLVDYPSITTDISFPVVVEPCILESFSVGAPSVTSIVYSIALGAVSISLPKPT